MSRFDTASSYLQGFGSGQSIVNHGVANADAMQNAVAHRQQLQLAQQHQGLAQQEHDLRLHEFDWRTSQAAQKLEQQHQRAAIVGNLGLTLLKQKPSAAQVDPVTGAAVGNPDNEVDNTLSHWIQVGIDTGNADALEKMLPKLQTAQQRQEIVNKIKYVKENGFTGSLANPDEKAIMDLAETAASPQMLERGLSMKVARQHREQQDAAKAQAAADLKANQEQQAGSLSTHTAPDGTQYGDIGQFQSLMTQPPAAIAKAALAQALPAQTGGLSKKDQQDEAYFNSPMYTEDVKSFLANHKGSNLAEAEAYVRNRRRGNENQAATNTSGRADKYEPPTPTEVPDPADPTKTIKSFKGKNTPLEWSDQNSLVQHFRGLATQFLKAQPGANDDGGFNNPPGTAVFGDSNARSNWQAQKAAQVDQIARQVAQRQGFVIGAPANKQGVSSDSPAPQSSAAAASAPVANDRAPSSPEMSDLGARVRGEFYRKTGRQPRPEDNADDARAMVRMLKEKGATPEQVKQILGVQ